MDIINQYQNIIPIIVFVVVLMDSLPFAGLVLPEELILTLGFLFSDSIESKLLVFIASSSAMFIGQMSIFLLSRKYGKNLMIWFRIQPETIEKLNTFTKNASFFDHILLRLSSNSMFRITAAFLTGLNNTLVKTQVKYEAISSILKTSIFLAIPILIDDNFNESQIESVLSRVALTIFAVTLVSLLISYLLKKRMNSHT